MGQVKEAERVKLIVGMLSKQEEMFARAEEDMRQLWGVIDISSEVMEFGHTKYYARQMGEGLWRKFVSFAELIDPGRLAAIKHQSNGLEAKYAQSVEGKALQVERPINLDPGYVEPSKLVLATTKNFSHRIYIGDSMYAEATLRYHKGKWWAWPYTYPDYAGGEYDEFLNQVRERLMELKTS